LRGGGPISQEFALRTDEDSEATMTKLMVILISLATQTGSPPPANQPSLEQSTQQTAGHPGGIWPNPKLLELLLARAADQMTERHKMSPETRREVREAFVDRWSTFLNTNRSELQPLLNEFLELRLELTPPDKKRVQQWAHRMTPIFEKIKQQVRESRKDLRASLKPDQQARFAAETMAMEVGLEFAEMKLAQYESGQFEDVDFWKPHGMDRKARRKLRETRRKKRREAVAKIRSLQPPIDQIENELSAWAQFTADFIRIYDLDASQRNAALSCLNELTERAKSHRRRHLDEIQRLEQRIASEKKSKKELAAIKEQLITLYGPIDEMFEELKSRLENIPTSEQRDRVAKVRDEIP